MGLTLCVTDKDMRDDYIATINRQDMVMSRINDPEKYHALISAHQAANS